MDNLLQQIQLTKHIANSDVLPIRNKRGTQVIPYRLYGNVSQSLLAICQTLAASIINIRVCTIKLKHETT